MQLKPAASTIALAAILAGCGNESGPVEPPPGPATLVRVSGDAQTASPGAVLPEPLSVRAAGTDGAGIPGLAVRFTIGPNEGALSTASATTDAGGVATVSWTLGSAVGAYTLDAGLDSDGDGDDDSQVTFTATAGLGGGGTARISGVVTLSDASSPRITSRRNLTQTLAVPPQRIRSQAHAPTPNELLVLYRSAASLDGGGAAERRRLAARFPGNRVSLIGVSPAIRAGRIRVADPSLLETVAAELRRDPAVASVERNAIGAVDDAGDHAALAAATAAATTATTNAARARVPLLPNDPLYPLQAWHYGWVDLPRAWPLQTGSVNVVVALVDNGILDHPAFAGGPQGSVFTNDGYDFVSLADTVLHCAGGGRSANAGDTDGYDDDPHAPGDYIFNDSGNCLQHTSPRSAHGVGVAGVVGAVGNDSRLGTGVNWNVKIRPIRAFGISRRAQAYDVAQGILYAAGLPADNGVGGVVQLPGGSSGARIISLSISFADPSPVLEQAVQAVTNANPGPGALVIASAGNLSSSVPRYPAGYPEVVAVAAIGPDGAPASYSNFGMHIDLAAPGGVPSGAGRDSSFGVWTTRYVPPAGSSYDGGTFDYRGADGTSFAAPHVAGVAALLLAQNPSRTGAELRSLLETYARDAGTAGRDDRYGFGIVNARNSLTQTLAPPRQLYVHLIDAATGTTARITTAVAGGSYSFDNLPAGRYIVVAGEDEDADAVIGVPGRRWGAFGGLNAPTELAVQEGQTYPASFVVGFPAENEPNDATASANPLLVGGYMDGVIGGTSDNDVAKLVIATADQYTFETSARVGACGFATEQNTVLRLLDATGQQLASNDDIDAATLNRCSRISATLQPGTYHLSVEAASSGTPAGGGAYRLRVVAD